MALRWLAEDETHPARPDIPVFRHMTFTEIHAVELGVYIGLFAFFAIRQGYASQVVILLFGIIRYVMGNGKAKAGATNVTHNVGFHDVRQEPQYFGAGFLVAYALLSVVEVVWPLLGLGAF